MRSILWAIATVTSVVIGCWCDLAVGAEQNAKPANDPRGLAGTRHVVDARVIYPNRPLDPTIQAELEPGPFTIPEGYKAIDFKFKYGNPKTGYETDVLRPGNIKCVKSKRPPTAGDFKKGLELAAGEYLLIVGGFPGAQGGLSYTLVPDDNPTETKKPAPRVPDGSPYIHQGVWLPEKYFPTGYRLYPDDRMPPGDPPRGNGSQSLWFGVPLQHRGGKPSSSSGEHPYSVFIDGVTVFKNVAAAKRFFQMWKAGPPTKTDIALGEEAYIDDNCKDAGSLFKEFSSQNSGIFRRDLNVRNIRVGRVIFGLRICGEQVKDFNPNGSNHQDFIAHPLPSREEIMQVAKTFVDSVRQFANDRRWLNDN